MFKIASWVHTFEKCASQFARKSILPTDISILSGSEWPKKMALDHFNLASFTKYSSARWFYWTDWKESKMSFEEGEKKRTFPHPLLTFFSFSICQYTKKRFPIPSFIIIDKSNTASPSLPNHELLTQYYSISAQCKPIYFPLSITDSIKQCPMSTQLSQREWFIAESQVFASLCEAVQCKISSFIFHIAGAASLNILVSEHWVEDSLKFKCGIKKPVPGFEECTNIIKHISSCWSNVKGNRLRVVSDAVRFPNHCSLAVLCLKMSLTHNNAS